MCGGELVEQRGLRANKVFSSGPNYSIGIRHGLGPNQTMIQNCIMLFCVARVLGMTRNVDKSNKMTLLFI